MNPTREEIEEACKKYGAYINYESIRNMTDEEAEQMWDGFHETFTGRKIEKTEKKEE